jgi:hypothetical protein
VDRSRRLSISVVAPSIVGDRSVVGSRIHLYLDVVGTLLHSALRRGLLPRDPRLAFDDQKIYPNW